MKITDLRVQHIISPMGYRIDAPDFSWKLEADETELDTMVVSTRLTVATDPGMENVAAESVGVLNPLGTEMEMALRPRTVYYWQVTETLSNAVLHFLQTFLPSCDDPHFIKFHMLRRGFRKASAHAAGRSGHNYDLLQVYSFHSGSEKGRLHRLIKKNFAPFIMP